MGSDASGGYNERMNIELSPLEADCLRRVVGDRLATLRQEVRRTDTSSFKDDLKDSEALLRQLLSKLPAERSSAP
jgi:uncharacterized protein with von Willebrand factor type A (vWA) domain